MEESIDQTKKGNYEKELQELLKDPENQVCGDCGAKGPRWASYNLGVFLCIRCGGLHRKIGTHVTKVKSLTLDSWTLEQVKTMKMYGNVKANKHYFPKPEFFRIPHDNDNEMEQFIRDKYERKIMMFPESSTSKYRIGNSELKWAKEKLVLKDMGYLNEDLCMAALQKFDGDLTKAVDYLCAQPVTITHRRPSRPNLYTKEALESAALIAQMKEKEKSLVKQAVPEEPAVVMPQIAGILPGFVKATTSQNDLFSNSAFNQPAAQSLLAQSAAPASAPVAPVQSAMNDLNDIFSSNAPAQQQQQPQQPQKQQQPEKGNKNAILALFNQPSPTQNNFGQNAFGQGNAFGAQAQNPFGQHAFGQPSQQGFGQQAQQSFGQQQQAGFNQIGQAPFGQQNQSGFGQQQQSTFSQQGQQPFGQATQSGFNQQGQQPFGQFNQNAQQPFTQAAQQGFGQQTAQQNFNKPGQSGFGQQPNQQAVGLQQQPSFAQPQQQNQFGFAQHQQQSFAQPSQQNFGQMQQQGFGLLNQGQQAAGFGQPQNSFNQQPQSLFNNQAFASNLFGQQQQQQQQSNPFGSQFNQTNQASNNFTIQSTANQNNNQQQQPRALPQNSFAEFNPFQNQSSFTQQQQQQPKQQQQPQQPQQQQQPSQNNLFF